MASKYTKRAPADTCNFVGKEVAFGAYANTPYVTAPKIDAELDVIVSPVIGKRGKPLKNRKQYSIGKAQNVPLAALIIQARANSRSRYNVLTNLRYALSGSPFKGVSRQAGAAAMAALIDNMIKSRRRSVSFIRAGWVRAMKVLKSLTPSRFGGKSGIPSNANEALGDVIPAQQGRTETFCLIENDVGLEGKNSESHNRALQQYGAPALQMAMDMEGRKQMDYVLKKMGREELEMPVNKAWS